MCSFLLGFILNANFLPRPCLSYFSWDANDIYSVMLSSMAAAFNITPSFLDSELSRFIAAGRLNAKIDKVGDIIETSRSDKKSAQFQEVVKRGDLLLNRIQKLVRVIDV